MEPLAGHASSSAAHEPHGIGSEAGSLGGAGNENRRVFRLGRKKRFVHSAIKRREKLAPIDSAAIESQ